MGQPSVRNATPATLFAALLAFAVALSASGFILEHGFGATPCPMCWWQRYAHWAIGGFALTGYALPQRPMRMGAAFAVGAASLVGLYIALWQFAAQNGLLPFPPSCGATGASMAGATDLLAAMGTVKIVPCDEETFTLLGLSLAAWNIPAMLTTLAGGILIARKLR